VFAKWNMLLVTLQVSREVMPGVLGGKAVASPGHTGEQLLRLGRRQCPESLAPLEAQQ